MEKNDLQSFLSFFKNYFYYSSFPEPISKYDSGSQKMPIKFNFLIRLWGFNIKKNSWKYLKNNNTGICMIPRKIQPSSNNQASSFQNQWENVFIFIPWIFWKVFQIALDRRWHTRMGHTGRKMKKAAGRRLHQELEMKMEITQHFGVTYSLESKLIFFFELLGSYSKNGDMVTYIIFFQKEVSASTLQEIKIYF